MSVEQRKDGRWRVHYYDSYGVHRSKSFGRGKLAQRKAKAFDLEIKQQKALGHIIKAQPSFKGLSLPQLLDVYLQDRLAAGVSKKFVKEWGATLVNHIIPLLPQRPVNRLEYRDFLPVLAYYKDHSVATRNRYMRYLRAIFNFGIRHGLTQSNPLERWRPGKEDKKPLHLNFDDIRKIIDNAEPHLKWAIELEVNIGTRPGPSELLALRWEHVDFEENVIRVYATKTKEPRLVPFGEDFRERLLEMKAKSKSGYLIEYLGKPVKSLRRAFNTACRKAELPFPVRMYDLRHVFATIMLSKGGDLKAVSELLGHSSTKLTSDTYYHLIAKEKRRAVSLIPKL